MSGPQAQAVPASPWQMLETLASKARAAETEQALWFVVANDTFALLPYRSALVLTVHHNEPVLVCASGLTMVDRRSAFGSWVEQVVATLLPRLSEGHVWSLQDVEPALQEAWLEYWPQTVRLFPVADAKGQVQAVVVYVLDAVWPPVAEHILGALHQVHGLCLQGLRTGKGALHGLRELIDGRNLKTRKYLWRGALVLALLALLPIRQFVVVPAEIVALDAVAVTSPVEGIVAELVAKPNQRVQKGDVLVRLDDTAIRNRLATARQGLEVARAEFLAGAHRSFVASDRQVESGVLRSRIQERLAEVQFLDDQLAMQDIRASRDGVAVYGQENDWIGKPVSPGQRLMELADSSQVGVHAWVPVADAINMQSGQSLLVLLYASPLSPLTATVEQASYQASRSPDGVMSYRVRATLPAQEQVRLGLRGNAKINGDWVVLGYMVLRRPIMAARQWLGL